MRAASKRNDPRALIGAIAVAAAGCPTGTLDLTGGETEARCAIAFDPEAIIIDRTGDDRGVWHAASITNRGSMECTVVALFARDDHPELKIDALPLPLMIPPGEQLALAVALGETLSEPPGGPSNARFENALIAVTATGERIQLSVSVEVAPVELLITPPELRLQNFVGCSDRRTIGVFNTGLLDVLIAPELTGDTRMYAVDPLEARVVPPSGQVDLDVVFAPFEAGHFEAVLRVGALGVELIGDAVHGQSRTDMYRTPPIPDEDVLVVIDNRPEMAAERARILTNLQTWARLPHRDARREPRAIKFAITSADTSEDGARGRLFPLGRPSILTATSAEDAWLAAFPAFDATEPERGLQAMELALSDPLRSAENRGFPRPGARVYALFISADDDHSAGPVLPYLAFLGTDGAAFTASGIEGCGRGVLQANPSPRYLEAARTTGGAAAMICLDDWASELATALPGPLGPTYFIPLSTLARPSSIEVRVDGVLLPREGPSANMNWTYVQSGIQFSDSAVGWDQEIRITYEEGCGL